MRRICLILALPVLMSAAQAAAPDACAYSTARAGVSCLVLQDGRIVHEVYDDRGAVDRAWGLASGTKSFSGLVAAAAVQDGLFRLDDPAATILTEWQADARRQVTIRQVLHLVSGIDTPSPRQGLRIDYAQALALPQVHAPGTTFAYGQAPFQIFAALVERKLAGESFHAYLRRRILDPLGITLQMRQPRRGGDPSWGGGGSMTARDWARFGEFVRQGGRWQGVQLVDPGALAQVFQGSRTHPGYGLGWWLKLPRNARPPAGSPGQDDFHGPGADDLPVTQVWMAAGAGKQRLYVLPERNLVAVRQTARMLTGGRDGYSDLTFLQLLLQ